MKAMRSICLAAVTALSLTSFATGAHAHPAIRDEVRNQTMGDFADVATKQLNYLPCYVCHEHGNTGLGSVRTPFGRSVRAHGLDLTAAKEDPTVALPENVFNVIHAMDAENVDSDGDGVADMNELRAKTDPNTYGPVKFADETEAKHGCQCDVAGPSSSPTASLGVAALGLVGLVGLVSARRASRRGRPSRA